MLADGWRATRIAGHGTREVPDHRIRLDAYEQATRAYGFVPKSQELPGPPPPGLSVVITVIDPRGNGTKQHEPRDVTPPGQPYHRSSLL